MNGAWRNVEESGRANWRATGRLLRYVAPHRWLLTGLVAFLVVYSLSTLAGPWVVGKAVVTSQKCKRLKKTGLMCWAPLCLPRAI